MTSGVINPPPEGRDPSTSTTSETREPTAEAEHEARWPVAVNVYS
jgi:hypothetical protein